MSLPAGLVDVPASSAQIGCSRATLYKLMAQKKLDARKLGGKTVITSELDCCLSRQSARRRNRILNGRLPAVQVNGRYEIDLDVAAEVLGLTNPP